MCEWRTIEGFEDYEISDEGQVYSRKSNKIIKSYDNGCGYLFVCPCKDGKKHMKKVHRLVAEAFIPNPDNLPQVNHIDEDKTNNNVSNLEWCTAKYNINYGTRTERTWKPIAAYSKSGELVAEYPSLTAAAEAVGCNQSNISACLNGRQKTSAGYVWKYV